MVFLDNLNNYPAIPKESKSSTAPPPFNSPPTSSCAASHSLSFPSASRASPPSNSRGTSTPPTIPAPAPTGKPRMMRSGPCSLRCPTYASLGLRPMRCRARIRRQRACRRCGSGRWSSSEGRGWRLLNLWCPRRMLGISKWMRQRQGSGWGLCTILSWRLVALDHRGHEMCAGRKWETGWV